MKKKLFIGTLAFASLFTMYSFDEYETQSRRPMFGSEVTGWGPCRFTGEIQADGTPVTVREIQVTTYIFWIGFKSIESEYNQCTP